MNRLTIDHFYGRLTGVIPLNPQELCQRLRAAASARNLSADISTTDVKIAEDPITGAFAKNRPAVVLKYSGKPDTYLVGNASSVNPGYCIYSAAPRKGGQFDQDFLKHVTENLLPAALSLSTGYGGSTYAQGGHSTGAGSSSYGAGGQSSGAGSSPAGAGGYSAGAGGSSYGTGGQSSGAGSNPAGAGGYYAGAGSSSYGAGGQSTGAGGSSNGTGGSGAGSGQSASGGTAGSFGSGSGSGPSAHAPKKEPTGLSVDHKVVFLTREEYDQGCQKEITFRNTRLNVTISALDAKNGKLLLKGKGSVDPQTGARRDLELQFTVV